MAISWSGWDYGTSGNEGFRVGVEVSLSSVSHSSSSVTITTKWYLEAMYNVNDSMTLTFGGSISGSDTDNFTTPSSGGVKLWSTKTYTYNYSTYGSSPGTRTFSASLSGVYNGANPSKSTTVTIPARPYGVPAAPTGAVATRNSDTQATVSWTNHATSGEPYTSLTVQMKTYTGGAWSGWTTVATTSSGATSYIKTGLSANHGYQFQVRANNSAGSSAFNAATAIYMTPAAPSGVASVLNSTGATITTSWTANNFDSPNITYTVQRSVNGGAYANVATGLTSAIRSWTDPTPGAGSNTYQVAAVHLGLSSAFVAGNTITTIVAPLAPTLLSPNGTAVDFTRDVTFTWKHNSGGDSAAQSHFTLEVSSNGGTTWTAYTATDVASTASARTIPAGTLTNGTPYLWRVKTEGIVSGGYGPFSASATVTGSSTPTVTLSAPTAAVSTLPLIASWAYNQDQGSPQTAWEAVLYNAAGTVVLESQSGFDATSDVVFFYALQDTVSYQIKVRARSGAGIWSDWAVQAFAFNLLPPAAGIIDAQYQDETGTVALHITNAAPVAGVTVAVDSAIVERRVNGGSWTVLATNLPVPSDFLDILPVTNGDNEYRVTTVSTSPSYNVGNAFLVQPPNGAAPGAQRDQQWVFLNYGDDFTQLLRFRSAPNVSEVGSSEKVLHDFDGRDRPFAAFGDSAGRVVSAEGSLVYDATRESPEEFLWDSPPEDWTFAGRLARIVCYRDFTGRRLFGTLSDVQSAETLPGLGTVGFSVTETDFAEPGGYVDREALPGPTSIIDGGNAYSTDVSIIDGGAA